MPYHNRYVQSNQDKKKSKSTSTSSLSTTIWFFREDLLLRSEKPIVNPYSGEEVEIPYLVSPAKNVYVGPNIHDCLERKESESQKNCYYWRIREHEEFFANPKKDELEEDQNHPFLKKLATGGEPIEEVDDNFWLVKKASSVSLNTLVYNLSVGMSVGDVGKAVDLIGELASKAWKEDIYRAKRVYSIIATSKNRIIDESELFNQFPLFEANHTISQVVEHELLSRACRWIGVDPSIRYSRGRGRPRRVEMDQTEQGEIIKLTLDKNDNLTGQLIGKIGKYAAGLDLEILPLFCLVEILSLLQDQGLSKDVDLLEAYLDVLDEAWRDRVFEELEKEEAISDPYSILGLEKEASLEEIKKAYRSLMKKCHPDTSNLPKWIAIQINKAYQKIVEPD
ncbi:MAG: J domain-containing protein [Xenococcus sp. (in: cyanobacteria)]